MTDEHVVSRREIPPIFELVVLEVRKPSTLEEDPGTLFLVNPDMSESSPPRVVRRYKEGALEGYRWKFRVTAEEVAINCNCCGGDCEPDPIVVMESSELSESRREAERECDMSFLAWAPRRHSGPWEDPREDS